MPPFSTGLIFIGRYAKKENGSGGVYPSGVFFKAINCDSPKFKS